jgi:CYTH domain-containing protein
MAVEIERRFLLKNSFQWKDEASGPRRITQIYLGHDPVVRLRVYEKFDKPGCSAYMTIKGRAKKGEIGRPEFEWKIPQKDAKDIVFGNMAVSDPIIKDRYTVMHEGLMWEIDVFDGLNEGLMIAEIEMTSEDQKVGLPSWVGEEITDDHRYANSSLSKNPWKDWSSPETLCLNCYDNYGQHGHKEGVNCSQCLADDGEDSCCGFEALPEGCCGGKVSRTMMPRSPQVPFHCLKCEKQYGIKEGRGRDGVYFRCTARVWEK